MFYLYIIAERENVLEVSNETKNLTNLPTINILDVVKVIYQIKSKISDFPILDPKLSNKTRSLVLRKERKLYSKLFKKLKFVIFNHLITNLFLMIFCGIHCMIQILVFTIRLKGF